MSTLIERLRAGGRRDASGYIHDDLPINPDGPEAADRLEQDAKRIEALERENSDLRKITGAMQARYEGQLAAVKLLTTPTLQEPDNG